jgi:hypothetical protein
MQPLQPRLSAQSSSRPRVVRLLLVASLTVASVLGAYACDNGTFPNALNVYDPDGGHLTLSEDSSTPVNGDAGLANADAQADANASDATAHSDGGDAGDAGAADAADAGSESDASTDASDSADSAG